MLVAIIRSIILYVLVILSVRHMGKRQLGEFQPSELVITILISNIATLPLEDPDIPLLTGTTPIFVLVCLEVLISWVILRFPKMRRFISGSPKTIITNGTIDREALTELRLSEADVMSALRSQQVFDIKDVQKAVVETNGNISVMVEEEKS